MISRRPFLLLAGLALLLASRPARAQEDLNEALEKMVKEAVKKASPSVVQIVTQGGSDVVVTDPKKGQIFRKALGPTTGVIVDADGYVITSAFNFINNPTGILVDVPGRPDPLVAKRVATDKSRMLTLLKIDAKGLPVPVVAPKKEIEVGHWAMALGRTLDAKRNAPPSISLGIISAKGRIWGKALQTDAKTSPLNYGGALVDIQGRVQGVIVPASPHDEDLIAGYEWYDSGLGFAIPLEDIMAVLPRLKEGRDLEKGSLGIRTKSQDIFGAVPEISDVVPNTPASRAGLKAGDIITAVDGKAVVSMAQIKHILGAKYEGDKVELKVKRGGKEEVAKLDLSGTTQVAGTPFLGILPMRDDPKLGVEVRYVFDKSPADKAGIKPGDRIVKYGAGVGDLTIFTGEKQGRSQLLEWLNAQSPGTDVKLEVKRKGGKTDTVSLALAAFPGTAAADDWKVPDKLPQPATFKKSKEPLETSNPNIKPAKVFEKNPPKPETGLLKRNSNDGERKYWVYVHEDYDPNVAHALVVWLHPPGKTKDEDVEAFTELWEDFCKDNHIILLGPLTQAEGGWIPSDADYVTEAIRAVVASHNIDRQRVVAHGMGIGGQMAMYLGFNYRDLVRGVASTGAVVTQLKENQRNLRLSFFLAGGAVDPIIKSIAESRTKLLEQRYPVVYREIANRGREYFEEAQLRELIRWIDSLDKQ